MGYQVLTEADGGRREGRLADLALKVLTTINTAKAAELQRSDYEAMLKGHDWLFDFSDDSRVYRRGHYERQALMAMQPMLDPDFELWNAHAPQDQRRVPREEWRCMACGSVTAIGDTPVNRGCKCL